MEGEGSDSNVVEENTGPRFYIHGVGFMIACVDTLPAAKGQKRFRQSSYQWSTGWPQNIGIRQHMMT